MRFYTVINCMDGRVQLPVIRYLQKRFNVEYVDSITEAGPNLILSEEKSITSIQSILERLKISIEHHNSVGVAIVGHHDCAGNPAPQNDQIIHIQKAIQFLRQQYENIEIIGIWIDKNWEVHEVIENKLGG
ncbi:MAG TPA: carbonic anhydrase [Nitrospinota bacterium]|nr:carbonic anhydrase [Nitrospinota bacterium]